MESPIRLYQKQKDYQRHKLFRKIKRRRERERKNAINAPIKELRRRMKQPVRFRGGKDQHKGKKYGYDVEYMSEAEAMKQLADNMNRTAVMDEVVVTPSRRLPMQAELSEGITNQAANERADAYANDTAPTAMDIFNIGTLGGLNNLSPTQWVRRAYDLGQVINGSMPWNKFGNDWFYGNNGLVSDEYAKEHPYASTAINLVGDVGAFGTFSALRKLPKYAAMMEAENRAAQEAAVLNWKNMLANSVRRTRLGDVEIDNPNIAYRQGNDLGRTYQKYKDIDASVAQHQIEDNLVQSISLKDGKPYISREKALDKAIASGTYDPVVGIEVDGHSVAFRDTPMYSNGFLWYGTPKIDESLPPGSLQSGLLITPRNDAFIIGSNKATPYKGLGSGVIRSKSGVTTVTDNGGRLIPADTDNLGLELNNISAYTWEPGYGYRRVFTEETPTIEWADAARTPKITAENAASNSGIMADAAMTAPSIIRLYHGSPVRFDKFDAQYIGSGEGGSKVMRGINLWPEEKIGNAPKFANIKSPDAPLHLGVSSTQLGGELNPTVYDVSGRGLKLYKASPREVKRLSQSDLVSQGYDGIQTPNQVTVFPESIGKLSIDKQSSIEDFIINHPEVERWASWTTDNQKMQNIIDRSRMSIKSTPQITAENAASMTPEQWNAAFRAAHERGDRAEGQRLWDLWFKQKAPTKTPGKYYRGTQVKRTSYPDRHVDEEVGEMNGIYLTKNPKYAKTYGDVEEFYLRSNNPLETEGSWTGVIDDATRAEIENAGYDAIVNNKFDTGFLNRLLRNSRDETITFDSRNIKSAEPFTYADDDSLIDLTDRANFKVNDIRYILPWGIVISYATLGGLNDGNEASDYRLGYQKGKDKNLQPPKFQKGTDDNRVQVTERTYPDGCPDFYKNVKEALKYVPATIGLTVATDSYNRGKDIYIKPSKRGTFTAAAKKRGMSVQQFASKVLKAPKGKYSASMRKKANFAKNASKWKK